MNWSPPLWLRALEAFQFLFFPVAIACTAVYSFVVKSDIRGALVLSFWSLLMFLMAPLLMGDEKCRRETLEFYRAPACVVRLYCETGFPAFLTIAFFASLFGFSRGSSP